MRAGGSRVQCGAGRKTCGSGAGAFWMARAYMAEHKVKDAREEVISALEVAPDYKPALKLLLELNGKE